MHFGCLKCLGLGAKPAKQRLYSQIQVIRIIALFCSIGNR